MIILFAAIDGYFIIFYYLLGCGATSRAIKWHYCEWRSAISVGSQWWVAVPTAVHHPAWTSAAATSSAATRLPTTKPTTTSPTTTTTTAAQTSQSTFHSAYHYQWCLHCDHRYIKWVIYFYHVVVDHAFLCMISHHLNICNYMKNLTFHYHWSGNHK